MPNPLTGDFEAVVQIDTVPVVNEILAGMHERAAYPDASPTLLHSLVANVAETNGGPPGVNGIVEAQLSTITVTLAPPSPTDLLLHCQVRARYHADYESVALPTLLHGDVQATMIVGQATWENGERVLTAAVTDDDAQITFAELPPGSVTSTQRNLVTEALRAFLRTRIEPIDQPIGADLAPLGYTLLFDGSKGVVALPVNLSGAPLADTGLASINGLFLGSERLAIAISREYLEPLFAPTLAALQAFSTTFTIPILTTPFGQIVAIYTATVTSVTLTWQDDRIVLMINGTATGVLKVFGWIPPFFGDLETYSFAITQGLTLTLDPDSQTLALVADGEPVISGLPEQAVPQARAAIVIQRDQALAALQGSLPSPAAGLQGLEAGLAALAGNASAKLSAVQITTDGIILRGTVGTTVSLPVQVTHTLSADGVEASARESWVPGGTVDRFSWTVSSVASLGGKGPLIPGLTTEHREHDFLFHFPEDVGNKTYVHKICLTVEGRRLGTDVGNSDGQSCKIAAKPWFEVHHLPLPSTASGLLAAAIGGPFGGCDFGEGGITEDDDLIPDLGGAGAEPGQPGPFPDPRLIPSMHLDVLRLVGQPDEQVNALLHFTGDDAATSLAAVIDGVPARSLQDAPLSTTVVLPTGGLARLDHALVDRLPELALSLGGALSITEDYEGGWTGAFGLPSAPNEPVSYLFSAGGGRAWEHRGPLEASIVTRALDGHLVPAERSPFRMLDLGVWTGDPAPDFLFPYHDERRMALRRLRGPPVTLFFWKSWSSACLSELRRMQRLHLRARRQHGIILAINDGESAERVEAVRRRYGLTLPLMADPRRQISQRYGLIGWPTTVMIDARGIVSQIVTGA